VFGEKLKSVLKELQLT